MITLRSPRPLSITVLCLVCLVIVLFAVSGAAFAFDVFSTGPSTQPMGVPEAIVQLPSGDFLVPDASFELIWKVPPTGGIATPLSLSANLGIGPIGGVLLPSPAWGSNAGKFLTTGFVSATPTKSKIFIIDPGGGATSVFFDNSLSTSSFTFADALIAPSGFGSLGGNLLVADEIGKVWIVTPTADVTQLALLGFSAFGETMGSTLLVSQGDSSACSSGQCARIATVDASGNVGTFATVPLASGQLGLRQMAFSPSGFIPNSGPLLFVSVSGSQTGGGTLGDVLGLNSDGTPVVSLRGALEGLTQFDPRGLLFTGGNLLVSDSSSPAGRILRFTPQDFCSVDGRPVATDDAYSTNEDTVLDMAAAQGVLGNDTPSGLTAVLVTNFGPGSVTLNADGSFVYTPPSHFSGTATFTYKAFNGTCFSNVATVTITVNHVNHPPVAYPDNYVTEKNTPLEVQAPGVLGNDTDVDVGDTLSASLVSPASHGFVTLDGTGHFTYTPTLGFSGTDFFTYRASDGLGTFSNEATVTIKVNDSTGQTGTVLGFSPPCDIRCTLTFNPINSSTFVIRPTNFLKHWNCRLFRVSTGEEINPKSQHGPPGITLQINGDATVGDLQLLPASTSATFTTFGNLCQLFSVTDGDFRAECTAENSITDPTHDANGACLDPTGVECLAAPIRTYVEPAPPFLFTLAGGTIVGDQCPDLAGNAGGTGCPFAIEVLVRVNGVAASGVVMRVFDRNSPDFRRVTNGDKNPPASLNPAIFEADQGRVAACVTNAAGRCDAGVRALGDFLLIVEFPNPTTGAPDYQSLPGVSSDFKKSTGIAFKEFNIKR